jgi:hypothetical protein
MLLPVIYARRVQVHCQLGAAAPAMHWPRHCDKSIETPAMHRITQNHMLLIMLLIMKLDLRVQVHCQLGPAAPRPRHCGETLKAPAV